MITYLEITICGNSYVYVYVSIFPHVSICLCVCIFPHSLLSPCQWRPLHKRTLKQCFASAEISRALILISAKFSPIQRNQIYLEKHRLNQVVDTMNREQGAPGNVKCQEVKQQWWGANDG